MQAMHFVQKQCLKKRHSATISRLSTLPPHRGSEGVQTVPARSNTRSPFEELPVISSQISETDWRFSNYSTRLLSDRGTFSVAVSEAEDENDESRIWPF